MNNGYAFTAEVRLEVHTCQACGTTFAVPSGMYRRFNENGAALRCPNTACAWISFVRIENEVEALKKALATKESALLYERNERALAEAKLVKVRKRVGNGVCPCCKRSFAALGRHMKTKHPDYVKP